MPDEIYDEIELLLGSMTPLETSKDSLLKPDDFVDLSDYRIDLSSSDDSVPESSVEETTIPEPILVEEPPEIPDSVPIIEEKNDDSIIFEPIKEEEVPVIEDVEENLDVVSEEPKEKNDNRLKVIQVDPLSLDTQDVEKLDSSTENSDDEYISFNNLLEGDENGNTN